MARINGPHQLPLLSIRHILRFQEGRQAEGVLNRELGAINTHHVLLQHSRPRKKLRINTTLHVLVLLLEHAQRVGVTSLNQVGLVRVTDHLNAELPHEVRRHSTLRQVDNRAVSSRLLQVVVELTLLTRDYVLHEAVSKETRLVTSELLKGLSVLVGVGAAGACSLVT